MKNKETMHLWVLDFNDKAVYKYAVMLYADESEYLKMLEDVGHELSKIEWMISPYDEAIDATTDLRDCTKEFFLQSLQRPTADLRQFPRTEKTAYKMSTNTDR